MLYIVHDNTSAVNDVVVEANCIEQAHEFGLMYFASNSVRCHEVDNSNGEKVIIL